MISVIVPVYNAEAYLEKCVRSILAQTHRNLEILLVNDGSKDGSLAICRALAEEDSRILVLDGPNGGPAAARNRGLEAARGEYIGFVDSDDWLDERFYEVLVRALEKENADVAECGAWYVSESTGVAAAHPLRPRLVDGAAGCAEDFADLRGSYQCTWNKLYRRAVVGPVRYQPYARGEDALFNAQVICRCRRKVILEECLYHYLVRETGLGRSVRPGTELDAVNALTQIYGLIRPLCSGECRQLAQHITDHALARYLDGYRQPPENWQSIRKELKRAYVRFYPVAAGAERRTLRQKMGFLLFRLSPELYIRYNWERKRIG